MTEPIKYNEKYFSVGTRVCSKETGSIGIVQSHFGNIGRLTADDLLESVPIIWESKKEKGICPVHAVYLTDNFTTEFSDALKASVNADCWY